jgi:hypothetical protein
MDSREDLNWDDVQLMEGASERLLFPGTIKRRQKDGSFSKTKILLRVPGALGKLQGRSEARTWFAELKLDPDRDKDYLAQLEEVCIIALAVRSTNGHGQHMSREEIAALEEPVLVDLRSQLTNCEALMDGRLSGLSEEQLWKVIIRVAKGANLGPLLDIAGHEQPSSIVRMAREACHSPTGKRWQQLFEISIPEPSQPPPSSNS